MKSKFPERKRLRHKDFDYSNPGYYFITICSEDKEEIFGRIEKGKMILSESGRIVYKCWYSIPEHFPDAELDQFQIMPDHLHGIIIINPHSNTDVGDAYYASRKNSGDAKFASPTDRTKMLLSIIIQQFKRQVTIETRSLHNKKIFQRSFYDRIIRNEKELYNIRKYIIDNPMRWELEKDSQENPDMPF